MPAKHQKHAALTRPHGGRFHKHEWGVIGAPCSIISNLISDLTLHLSNKSISVGYLDMAHNAEELDATSDLVLIDKLNHWSLSNKGKLWERDYRKYFNSCDILFVNGNHYKADKQIVIVNQKKKDSLHRKLDRLTDIIMVILDEGETEVHDYLKGHLSESTPIISIGDKEQMLSCLIEYYKIQAAPLKGLVLNGGKSQRMGTPKGELNYHGISQKKHEADLVSQFCHETFYSVATTPEITEDSYKYVEDTFIGLGPFGGIVSAFRQDPNAAWLTVACDLPYLDKDTIKQLVASRNTSKLATCFYNPETDFPEPLITIWEPRAYPVLLDYLSQGYSCPRKILINSDIEMINMTDPTKMKNANTPEERKEAEKYFANNS